MDLEKITPARIQSAAVGSVVTGIAILRALEIKKTKNGADYLVGTLTAGGDTPMKIWGGPLLQSMQAHGLKDFEGNVYNIGGKVDEYNGVRSLVVESVNSTEGIDPDELLEGYDIEKWWTQFNKVVERNLTPEGLELFNLILEPVQERFVREFAGKRMHDAKRGGLLGHSTKCTFHMEMVFKLYPVIAQKMSKDLCIIGVALHDIGKVDEYYNGTPTELAYATHRIFGLEYIMPHKDHIEREFGTDWYYRLLSVITQHHGQWGERPQTKEALLVHWVDYQESRLTILSESLENNEPGTRFRLDDFMVV